MRLLVTGSSGQLGAYVLAAAREAGRDLVAWSGRNSGQREGFELMPVDLTDEPEVWERLSELDPSVILHLAAMSRADAVHRDPVEARRVNVDASRTLARWARDHGRRLVFASTDLVFDGEHAPYGESDEPRPLLAYGRSKLEAERAVAEACPGAVIARLSLLYGPTRTGEKTFYDHAIEALRDGQTRAFFEDEFRTPLDYGTAARALLRACESDESGLLHLGGPERLSRCELFRKVARASGLDESRVTAGRMSDVAFPEPRPVDVSLDTARMAQLFPELRRPGVEEATRAFQERI